MVCVIRIARSHYDALTRIIIAGILIRIVVQAAKEYIANSNNNDHNNCTYDNFCSLTHVRL